MSSNKTLTTVSLVERSSGNSRVSLVNPDSTQKMHDPMDLIELARQVQKSDEFIRANACNRLTVIAEQIRYLQEQAVNVLQSAKRDADLHHAACNFKKIPGNVYYLYRRDSGQTYFSMLSPEDWGETCPHEYLGTYKLEYDMSWTPEENIAKRGKEMALIDKLLSAQGTLKFLEEPNFRALTEEQEEKKENTTNMNY